MMRGRVMKTVRCDEMPTAYGSRSRCKAKGGHIAEFGIGQDGRQREPRRAGLSQQAEGQAPFLLKPDRRRDPRSLPRGGRQPFLGEIQRRADTPRPDARPQRRGDGDLAIRDLAECPTVLTGHADRGRPLFGKAGPVENQHPAPFRQHRPQPSPHAIGIPGRMRDEMLERLIRDRLGDAGPHRLHRLALAVAEDALHVGPQGQQLRAVAEARLELLQPSNQSLHPRRRCGIDQDAAAYRNRATSTMSSILISADFSSETLI
jgi:hypothetical protein